MQEGTVPGSKWEVQVRQSLGFSSDLCDGVSEFFMLWRRPHSYPQSSVKDSPVTLRVRS